MPIHKLSAAAVANGRLATGRRHSDGGGLYLQIGKNGSKAWVFQFSIGGRERQLGLGSLDQVSLADARTKAHAARTLVKDGTDPIEKKRKDTEAARTKAEAARIHKAADVSFQKVAAEYIAIQAPAWRSDKHADQWTATLRNYAYPVIGRMHVADIHTDDVVRVLKPIWVTKTETATRVRARMQKVFDYARAKKLRLADNPARLEGELEHLLTNLSVLRKNKPVRPMPALPYRDAPPFMKMLADRPGVSARALEVLILTASRTGALIGMRDEELDFDEMIWTVPASRMKAGRVHVVPLPPKAIHILKRLPRERGNPHLFAGAQVGSHLSNMSMLQLMRQIAPQYVTHGFRSCFADWAYEQTDTQHHIIEMALAHTIKNKAEAAYRRGDLLPKRRVLMCDWATYLFPLR